MRSDCKSKKRKFLQSISNKLYTFVIMNIYSLLKVYTRCKNLRLKAMGLLWSIVWAILIFNETITIKNVIGVVIVIVGTIIVNSEDE